MEAYLYELMEQMRDDSIRRSHDAFQRLKKDLSAADINTVIAQYKCENNVRVRGWLLELVAAKGTAQQFETVIRALHDPDEYVRDMALSLVLESGRPDILVILELASYHRFPKAADTNKFQTMISRAVRKLKRQQSARPRFSTWTYPTRNF